jgi:VanZ family protein
MKWAMLWALIILILCGIPGRDIPHISFLELLSFDKFVHAAIFFVLVLLTIRGLILQGHYKSVNTKPKLFAGFVCISYGGLLEVMQGTLFSERSADIYDFIANSFGCMVGIILYNNIERKILSRLIK